MTPFRMLLLCCYCGDLNTGALAIKSLFGLLTENIEPGMKYLLQLIKTEEVCKFASCLLWLMSMLLRD